MQSYIKGLMLSIWHWLPWKRQPFAITPSSQKQKDKRLFWPKYADLIPNVTQFVHKAYIITNKAQKFQILDDWQYYV